MDGVEKYMCVKQLTVSIDKETGDYTRLTQFEAGADTRYFGSKFNDYPD